MREVKRYRVSPTRGLVEDDGGIYPIGVSAPLVLAEAFDDVDRERMLAQGWGESILEKLTEVYKERDQLRALANRREQERDEALGAMENYYARSESLLTALVKCQDEREAMRTQLNEAISPIKGDEGSGA